MQPHLRLAVALVVLLIIGFFGSAPQRALAATIVVNPGGGGNYTTIQAAINNASPGDTIAITTGTYTESLNLSLMGSAIGGTTGNLQLVASDGPGTVTLTGAGAKISQSGAFNGALLVDGLRFSTTDDDALRLSAFTSVLVVNCTFDTIGDDNNAHNAIELSPTAGAAIMVVAASTFAEVANDAISVSIGGTAQAALLVADNTFNDDAVLAIGNNQIGTAIVAQVGGSATLDLTIRRNTITNTRAGVVASAGGTSQLRAMIANNTISGSINVDTAITVETLASATTATIDATVADNTIRKISGTGILFQLQGRTDIVSTPGIIARIARNTLSAIGNTNDDRDDGIKVVDANNPNVRGTATVLVEGNNLDGAQGVGLRVLLSLQSASNLDVVVRGNSFLNTVQAPAAIAAGIWIVNRNAVARLRASVTGNTATTATPETNSEIKLQEAPANAGDPVTLQLEGNASLSAQANLVAQNPTASEPNAAQAVGTVDIIPVGTITAPTENRPPVAVADAATASTGVATTIDPLGNDTDPSGAGDPRQLWSFGFTSQRGGTVALNNNSTPANRADDRLVYTSPAGFVGTDRLYYVAIDSGGATDIATVTLTVTATPVAQDGTATTNEGTPVTVTLSATGATTEFTIVAPPPGNGTVGTPGAPTCAAGACTATVQYTPNSDYYGADQLRFTASNGGNTSAPATIGITVNPVNDAPSFTKGADQTVAEDAGPQSVSGWATARSTGPANEASQTLTFAVTGNTNPGLFAAGPTIAAEGTLSYTPAANATGSATMTVVLRDNGGTANGGVDQSAPQTFTIAVNPINDAPTFAIAANPPTVQEGADVQTVANVASAISPGPADEAGQILLGFTVTNNTNPALFNAQPALAANGTLTYTPAPDAFGTAAITVTLQDNGGTANGGVNTSAPRTFTITVTGVNDAPSFTKGADQAVPEDAGAQTVAWATGISGGPGEAGQALTFNVTGNSNPGLFAAGPAVAPDGTLTYTPTANASGTAAITVTLQDNGGTANGGADSSAPQSFTITVNTVNDAPSFTKGADQTVLEDAGVQSVLGWATTISTGPADEAGQTLSFVITGNTDAALFTSGPAIAANGTLTYTLAPNAFGTATITVALQDNGGTAGGGQDTSAPQSFTITITPVNDAPVAQPGSAAIAEDTPGTITLTATDIDSAALSFAIVDSPAHGTLGPIGTPTCTTTAGVTTCTATATYTPAARYNGPDSLTFTASDGAATSAPATIAISVARGARATLRLTAGPGGTASANPPAGSYPPGTVVALTATPAAGHRFTGWTIDGAPRGFANPLSLTLDRDRTVVATFGAVPPFSDTAGSPYAEAIAQLAARGIIKGYPDGHFYPTDTVQRAQIAAFLVRALGWDGENPGGPAPFSDLGDVDPELARAIVILTRRGIAQGYPDGTFNPTGEVTHAQAISLISRSMVQGGYWQQVTAAEDDGTVYPNIPAASPHRLDLLTFVRYAGAIPDRPANQAWADSDGPSSRGWTAQVLWLALSNYFGNDTPGGGGYVP